MQCGHGQTVVGRQHLVVLVDGEHGGDQVVGVGQTTRTVHTGRRGRRVALGTGHLVELYDVVLAYLLDDVQIEFGIGDIVCVNGKRKQTIKQVDCGRGPLLRAIQLCVLCVRKHTERHNGIESGVQFIGEHLLAGQARHVLITIVATGLRLFARARAAGGGGCMESTGGVIR